ncbi:MAG: prolyl oligopeptidase family serine peptidase [Chitinophagaceae bacterium]|nr:prolyl oligopeptidase family serine peptidase [Chitinophagaceae bacterium]
MKKSVIAILFLLTVNFLFAQTPASLTVEKIMQDPKWIGDSPSDPRWSVDGKVLYFLWNPDKEPGDSLYSITGADRVPQKVTVEGRKKIVFAEDVVFNTARTAYTYQKNGDIFIGSRKSGSMKQITNTSEQESAPRFAFNDSKVVYLRENNLYAWDIRNGETMQLTDFQKGESAVKNADTSAGNVQEKWLEKEELILINVLKERKEKREAADAYNKALSTTQKLRTIYTGNSQVRNAALSNDGRFISYVLFTSPKGAESTIIPNYVTESGFTEDIRGRTKVGAPLGVYRLYIFDREKDTVLAFPLDSVEGIRDLPEYLKDYPVLLEQRKRENAVRGVYFSKISWSPKENIAIVDMRAMDNKDRWLLKYNAVEGSITLLDRQHDDAWIGGPGIYEARSGWIDAGRFWFQSESEGYAHLYIVDVTTGKKTAMTKGNFEIQECVLSGNRQYFYMLSNEVHPGEKQWYRLAVAGGKPERITTMTGANLVEVSPDEKQIAILYSYANKPWELYIQENKPGGKISRITHKAESELFASYPWRDPELIDITARDGVKVPARLYRPAHPHPAKPAVIFVHGAGYLQNAHKWWSSYFREYMFHNLLADEGYYVLDIDYRGSAGYGRDWRTAIYRHMGGKDLRDQVDGAAYLVDSLGVDPRRIGIYGGSYGGFITLMGLFTSPGTFAAGAALRPVTDWAHYNHGYTSNILNTPGEDSIAYRRSSPIYFAEGLKDQLLICHGVVDVNVHFQDVVRLNQRLIELGKNNWQVAMYPLEDHGFVEPSSWTDEYKRIHQLFESVLKR